MPCPRKPMKSFLIRAIPRGTAVALHVAWRVWDPGLAGEQCCVNICWAAPRAGLGEFLPPAGYRGCSWKGAPGPHWALAPLKCLPAGCFLAIPSFGIWVEAPSTDPWPLGCDSGCMRRVLGRESRAVRLGGTGHLGVSAHPGCRKLLAPVAY